MSSMTLSSFAEEVEGCLYGDAQFNRVCTDTRNIQKGDLFVALSGENFDGNEFVAAAVNKGAVAVVVKNNVDVPKLPILKVNDTRFAYGVIARANRRKFDGSVIALTGSAGKTTTKAMIASILSGFGDVLATQNNFNNEIGVPLTLLNINSSHQFAVVEMGASTHGDIKYLAQFAEPDVALVTNAMPAHIEGFGSVESIAETKGAIFESLKDAGVAIINRDDKFFDLWCRQAGAAKIITFGMNDSDVDVFANNIQVNPSGATTFTLHARRQQIDIKLKLLGQHNIANALAAAAASQSVGASLEHIKNGLESVQPVNGRLKVIPLENLTLIDDSYNANPEAVKAAVDVLAAFSGRRCLILGTMGELGEEAECLHKDVAHYAKKEGIEKLLVVGEFAQVMSDEFGQASESFLSISDLLSSIGSSMQADVVLVKGSRSAGMEKVVNFLITNKRGEG